MKKVTIPSYKEDLLKMLSGPTHAEGYLNAALEVDDKRTFLLALRDVAEAQGGMTKLARSTSISREHLYSLLSKKGNPGLETLKNLLSAIGLKLAIETKRENKKAA